MKRKNRNPNTSEGRTNLLKEGKTLKEIEWRYIKKNKMRVI